MCDVAQSLACCDEMLTSMSTTYMYVMQVRGDVEAGSGPPWNLSGFRALVVGCLPHLNLTPKLYLL